MRKRLSIMVPALNEEQNLKNTIKEIKKGIREKLKEFEIIIFNDGSIDKTGEIAQSLAKKDKKIRVVHNRSNRGVGYCYLKGQDLARFEYYMYIPADNQFPQYALNRMLDKIGTADIIIPYPTNMYIRPILRQIISYTFTFLMNLLFGLKLKYYNAPVIHRTDLLRGVPQREDSGYAYQAEILVRLIKAGVTFVEVGFDMHERRGGNTTAFKWESIERVLKTIIPLFWELQILDKKLYTKH